MSKARAAANRELKALVAWFLAAVRVCQRCRKRKARDVHHSRGRAGTLLLDWRYFKGVCRCCHDWIGENPTEARAEGFLCAAGLWNVPDRTPIPSPK